MDKEKLRLRIQSLMDGGAKQALFDVSEINELITEEEDLRRTLEETTEAGAEELERANNLEAQLKDLAESFNDIMNEFWKLLYPDDPTDWNYPGQVLNHVRVELERCRTEKQDKR